MTADMYYRVNGPNIVHEDFDGEMVVVNLETGCYYAFNPVGSAIWGHIEKGCTLAEMTGALKQYCSGNLAGLEQSVTDFLGELAAEQLISTGPATGNGEAACSSPEIPYAPPELEKFTDMQDLLLLDPIHEVDESGWPHPMGGDGEN
ncbi:MAG: pyrroloquinoline quinone biosynthesis protein PqqD [Desulfuromonas sp.]|nr:MAG: pyrroloquinoline quinone biosynthesis protein PqqD [Desulfuromonas sp.]